MKRVCENKGGVLGWENRSKCLSFGFVQITSFKSPKIDFSRFFGSRITKSRYSRSWNNLIKWPISNITSTRWRKNMFHTYYLTKENAEKPSKTWTGQFDDQFFRQNYQVSRELARFETRFYNIWSFQHLELDFSFPLIPRTTIYDA